MLAAIGFASLPSVKGPEKKSEDGSDGTHRRPSFNRKEYARKQRA